MIGTPPTLSAVIANYNHGHFLARAIEAMVTQSRPPDELLVLDDGSEDDSVAVISACAELSPPATGVPVPGVGEPVGALRDPATARVGVELLDVRRQGVDQVVLGRPGFRGIPHVLAPLQCP